MLDYKDSRDIPRLENIDKMPKLLRYPLILELLIRDQT